MPHQDEQYLDALDRALEGDPIATTLDRGIAETIERLRVMSNVRASLPPRPVNREVKSNVGRPAMAIIDDPMNTSRPYPRWSLVSAASLIVVISLLAVFLSQGRGNDSQQPELAASHSVTSPSLSCVEADRNKPFPSEYLAGSVIAGTRVKRAATYAPMYDLDVLGMSSLPRGGDVPAAEQAAIREAITERVECRNAGKLGWDEVIERLILSEYAAGGMFIYGGEPLRLDLQASTPLIYVPNVLDFRALAPGLIGVSLQVDVAGYGVGEFDVFRQIAGEWTLIDSVYTGLDGWVDTTSPANIPAEQEIQLWDDHVTPRVVFVRADTNVTIRVTNRGGMTHSLTIDSLGEVQRLQPGESTIIEFIAKPGQYEITLLGPDSDQPIVIRMLVALPQDFPATPVS